MYTYTYMDVSKMFLKWSNNESYYGASEYPSIFAINNQYVILNSWYLH